MPPFALRQAAMESPLAQQHTLVKPLPRPLQAPVDIDRAAAQLATGIEGFADAVQLPGHIMAQYHQASLLILPALAVEPAIDVLGFIEGLAVFRQAQQTMQAPVRQHGFNLLLRRKTVDLAIRLHPLQPLHQFTFTRPPLTRNSPPPSRVCVAVALCSIDKPLTLTVAADSRL